MNSAYKLIIVLTVYPSLIITLITNARHAAAAAKHTQRADRKLHTDDSVKPEFIGIDCGASEDYIDEATGLWYQTDKNFIETGINHDVVSITYVNPFHGPMKTVRSFPEGDRNCYTLKPKLGKNNTYNIRALFSYGNYDYKNQTPTFDLYIGANYFTTVGMEYASRVMHYDMVYHSSADIIQVCLVNTGLGTPFISLLELQSMNSNNSIYSNYSSSLPLASWGGGQFDVGASDITPHPSRYKDDPYHRMWFLMLSWKPDDWFSLNASEDTITEFGDSAYKLPSAVLKTAVQPANLSSSLALNWTYSSSEEFLVYLHFAEIQKLPKGHKRIINVSFGDLDSPAEIVTLEYLKPITLSPKKPIKGKVTFTIRAAAGSDAPPILNAFEAFYLDPQPNSLTDEADVDAILEIKRSYGISRINWQGDPCAPIPPTFPWDGLNCSSDKIPRIISLNLTSSKLSGNIATAFSKLQKLEFLDLSYNELTGPLPGFLAELPNLKFLDLTGNKLTGSIPRALKEKAYLQLSLADNPDFCQKDSCKEPKFVGSKFVIQLMSSIAVFLIIIVVSLAIWRLKRKRKDPGFSFQSQIGSLRPKNQAFSYLEILNITSNFKTTLGEGGFGKVYLGTLQDDTLVAVKLLSRSSRQGYKEFQSEVQLLMIVHHKNLLSLVGYCDESDFKALVYEYMDNGDLSHKLSVKNPNVLKWNPRLRIAVDTAKGLDYLHNGCKPPIIHRDLKPSNILLNSMMQAKISDFGLSRAFLNERDSHLSIHPAGTPGYIDPQFQRSGILNKQSDIYSFGMILLELITGFPPVRRASDQDIIFILDWIRPKIESGDIQDIIDSRLQGEFCTDSVRKALEIAMSCVELTPAQRPDISCVLQDLMECLALEMNDLRTENYRHGSCNSLDFTLPSPR